MAVEEAILKDIIKRERNRRIVISKTIVVEAEAPEEEEEAVMSWQTRSNISATTVRGTDISVMNAIVDYIAE